MIAMLPLISFEPGQWVPLFIFAIPIVAIAGGITAGIIKTLGQQRLIELAQRERMMAIERGIDPSKLPPLPVMTDDGPQMFRSYHDYALKRSQGLLIGGIITLFVGVAIGAMIYYTSEDHNGWAVGLIPASVGVALLLSSWLTRPKDSDRPATTQ